VLPSQAQLPRSTVQRSPHLIITGTLRSRLGRRTPRPSRCPGMMHSNAAVMAADRGQRLKKSVDRDKDEQESKDQGLIVRPPEALYPPIRKNQSRILWPKGDWSNFARSTSSSFSPLFEAMVRAADGLLFRRKVLWQLFDFWRQSVAGEQKLLKGLEELVAFCYVLPLLFQVQELTTNAFISLRGSSLFALVCSLQAGGDDFAKLLEHAAVPDSRRVLAWKPA